MSSDSSARIPARTLILYGLPGLVLFMPTIPAFVFLPKLYGDLIGLTAAGLLLSVARVFDVFTDPVIGALSDRIKTRAGQRKPWIAVGAVMCGFALIQLFTPDQNVTPVFFLTWLVLLYLGWTMVYVPYTAWGAEMSGSYRERARITGLREGLCLVGILIAGAMPLAGTQFGLSETESLAMIAWAAILLGLPTMAGLLFGVPEPGHQDQMPETPSAWKQEVKSLFANKPFLRLVLAWFVNGLANGIPAVLFLYFLEYRLEASETARGILTLLYFAAAVGAIPVWVWLNNKVDKHRLWCWAMIFTCAAFVWVPFLPPGSVWIFGLICVISGAGLGADNALPPALQADVLDYDEYKTGRRRAGVCFALWSMSTKLALAAAAGLALPAVSAFGFSPDGSNSMQSLWALAVIYAVAPVVLKAGAIALVWTFPITANRQRALRRRLDRRTKKRSSKEVG